MKIRKIKEIETSLKIIESLKKDLINEYEKMTFNTTGQEVDAERNFRDVLDTHDRNKGNEDSEFGDDDEVKKYYEDNKDGLLKYGAQTFNDTKLSNFILDNPNPKIYFKDYEDANENEAISKFRESLVGVDKNNLDEDGIAKLKKFDDIKTVMGNFSKANPSKFITLYGLAAKSTTGKNFSFTNSDLFRDMIENPDPGQGSDVSHAYRSFAKEYKKSMTK